MLVLVSGYSSEEKAGKQVLEKIDLVQAEAVQFFGRQGVDLLR